MLLLLPQVWTLDTPVSEYPLTDADEGAADEHDAGVVN